MSRNFNVAIVMLVLLSMSAFWLISYYTLTNLMRQQAQSLGPKLAQQAAMLVTEQVLTNDLISINVVLSQLTRDSVIMEAAVLNIDGAVMAASRADVAPPRSLLPLSGIQGEYHAPIALQDGVAGEVRLQLDLSYIEAGILNSLLFIVGATLLICIVAVTLSVTYFQYLLIFPLKLLAFSLQRIRRGEIDTIPEPRGNNEVVQTIRQYNATAQFIARNILFRRFTDTGEPAAGKPAPMPAEKPTLEATVLCVRIANFQYLASIHSEATIVRLLNRFYFLAGKVGNLYNGQVSQCADGEVIIGFTSPNLEEELGFYGICAAQLLLQLRGCMETTDHAGELLGMKLRAAVHSGPTVAGLYSPLNGQLDNVMGETLDLARTLCHECPDNNVLVSEKAWWLAGAQTRVEGQEYSILQEHGQLGTYLCSEPMGDIQTLLDRQAQQLAQLCEAVLGE